MKFSANLGFLWADRPLPDAIAAAKAAGFDAVECHWPYEEDPAAVKAALAETGLPMLGLNTRRGDLSRAEFGLAALPGRTEAAREAIDEALAYARMVDSRSVHVMAGNASGDDARACFIENLRHAARAAAPPEKTILIEPINSYDAPDYFLKTTGQALSVLKEVNAPNVKLMFDCYHVQLMEGDLSHRLTALMPWIGHIQFAGIPDRGPPDRGEVNYAHIFAVLKTLGYARPLGAEYRPGGATEASLGWMDEYRSSP